MSRPIRVTVWNEYRHERKDAHIGAVYPQGIHGALAEFLKTQADFAVRTATLDEPEHGLTEEALAATDVLIWWGHQAHREVQDAIVDRLQARVLEGMGLICLHSSHYSKIFKRLMGTTCSLKWREIGEKERLWVVDPSHPIASDLPEYIELEHEEMYGEFFDIPQPDTLVFVSWFPGGEVFRSGCCYQRGRGKVFYFRPGHETYPTFFHPLIRQVIANAARWAAPAGGPKPTFGNYQPREAISAAR